MDIQWIHKVLEGIMWCEHTKIEMSMISFVVINILRASFYCLVVRFYDGLLQLALIRTPREFATKVRAALTLTTSIPTPLSMVKQKTQSSMQEHRVTISLVSIHGSARTAKIQAIRRVRSFYRQLLLRQLDERRNGDDTAFRRKELDQMCRTMEETLDLLAIIDY